MSQSAGTPKPGKPWRGLSDRLMPLAAVAGTTVLALVAHRLLPHASLSMLFLTCILLVSARWGFQNGLVASLLSFLVYNFLFTQPQYTLKVDDDGDVATLVFFLVIAAIGGHLAARIHREAARREHSLAELNEARLTTERERLRSALLSSLSHDLRTPLASVIGSVSSVREYGARLADADRAELLDNALLEANRLDRYIQNLLDMTRIGQGKLTLERGWNDVQDIVGGAAARLSLVPGRPPLTVDIPPDFPLLWVHGALIEQALVNLLDNALRYAPAGSPVTVSVRRRADEAVIEVRDRGPGIPPEHREKVFDMFHTVGERGHGSGLGLAICRGMVAAHGGRVQALAGEDGTGTTMRITLRLANPGDPGAAA